MKFLSLDLELNQPSRKIIQVGICIAEESQPENEWLVKKWYLDPGEPLSAFITELTGITDDEIATNAVSHEQVATELGQLIEEHKCFVNPVTWGGGDSTALLVEFQERQVQFPFFGRRWIDVKTIFTFLQFSRGKSASGGLSSAMSQYKLRFKGTAHQADVDALNTMQLFFALLKRQRQVEGFIEWAGANK